ncbi:MAG: hypothetical protein V3S55_02460 [Nitrospiraceae bacterium]
MSLELIFNILPFLRRDLPDKLINENYLDTSGIRNAAKSEGSRLSEGLPRCSKPLQFHYSWGF